MLPQSKHYKAEMDLLEFESINDIVRPDLSYHPELDRAYYPPCGSKAQDKCVQPVADFLPKKDLLSILNRVNLAAVQSLKKDSWRFTRENT